MKCPLAFMFIADRSFLRDPGHAKCMGSECAIWYQSEDGDLCGLLDAVKSLDSLACDIGSYLDVQGRAVR